ncbi:Vacuolar protein sorting-associated protein 35 [Rhizoctonia solani]|uniref:Vacuolar protein sorting-associated protein 35 n=1 Tax=Rhizoctonia solani TaxID=456999 RepID=A0A8H7INM5_9AGAM|nr:Vacuolar protein sorting-associated protein 35 [Rhizoctonia solani]
MDDAKLLTEALGTVKIQMVQMKRCLENDQLMDALKSASTMLAELRTSSLSPKMYYELYMAVFDALRHVSNYLLDAHTSGRHHLADLYELVQYAGNIVPRLYLMITVGSVYMSIPEAPVKEIMKDMMEMSRGVQHPTRGLFLRHYLSGQTRDHLPVGDGQTESGNLHDSITFVLTNFIEMNKLWVRLQHQGHSREREKREMERRELRILVGTNLVRLSQLEGVDLNMYRTLILPSILEQIVSCKDVIAQEYLMEVVIQVFTDDFHLHTLTEFLSATAKLHPNYAAREAENEDPEEVRKQEEAAAKRLAEKVRRAREANGGSASPTNGSVAVSVDESKGKEKEGTPPKKFRGIPEDVKLFEVFWQQVVELIKPDLHTTQTTTNLLSLLLADHVIYFCSHLTRSSALHRTSCAPTICTRRAIAHAVVASVLKNNTIIDQPSDVGGVLEMCHVLVRDQRDAGAGMGMGTGPGGAGPMGAEEQGWVARMVHLFRAEALDVQFELLQTARRFFAEVVLGCDTRSRHSSSPPSIWPGDSKRGNISRSTGTTVTVESPDTALRLFLLAAQVCDSCGAAFEELAYEFYVQAFTVYEDAISESRAQLQAIALIIAAVHGAKLLKKPHQATAVMLASHMWWQTDAEGVETEGATAGEDAEERKPRRDGKRVLECLQKSLRIASSCFEEIVSVQLFGQVTPKYINSLIELIASNVDTISAPDFHPTSRSPPGLVEGVHTADMILRHFKRTLLYIESRKGEGDSAWEPRWALGHQGEKPPIWAQSPVCTLTTTQSKFDCQTTGIATSCTITMGKFYDTIPSDLVSWIQEQRCFWVATAPLSAKGHVNVSPKGVVGTFKIIDNKTFFYQDLTGSGPPRICRLFGTGNVYELGSTRYNELVPVEERLPGSRAAVVVDVHKVGTSCGFSVPLYKPDGERTILQDWTDGLETLDQEFANEKEGFEMTNPLSHLEFIPSSSDPTKDDRNPRGMKEYWAQENIRSIDGLPGLRFCRELVGLPPGPVKDDHKVFYIDMEAERLGKTLGSWTQQVVRKVGETGFLGGLAIGLALPLIWIHSTR